VLTYDRNPAVDLLLSPLALLRRWSYMRPTTDVFFFALAEEDGLSASAATYAVTTLMSALNLSAPLDAPIRRIVHASARTMNGLRFPFPHRGLCIVWDGKAMGCCSYTTIHASLSPTTRLGFRSYAPARMISSPWHGRVGPRARYLWPFVLCKLCLY
jgi:hypothetical protein